ncbi:MAG: toprim domain-containing protein [Deltaproteobacteria bacterium]|nr:toprim domain-containing protein [Deltaproteobacteria bacterium]MCX7952632.1 toprim domain-containing protein [Deltaproteobacteria bacterium]
MTLINRELEQFTRVFSKLPLFGTKTAFKLGLWLVGKTELIEEIIQSLIELKNLKLCDICGTPISKNVCFLCSDDQRDTSYLCVVEKFSDILAIERTKSFNGTYFCLGSLWSPVKGVGVDKLPIGKILELIVKNKVKEVILALPFTLQGDATSALIDEKLRKSFPNVRITRPARGLPKGAEIDQVDDYSLSYAFKFRERNG